MKIQELEMYVPKTWLEVISGLDADGNRYGEAVAGLSMWLNEEHYNRFIGQPELEVQPIEWEVDGVIYRQVAIFVNEMHDSALYGVVLKGVDDFKFAVVGAKVDCICEFGQMVDYLSDEFYFNE